MFCIFCFANECEHLVSVHYLFIGSKCFSLYPCRGFSLSEEDTVTQVQKSFKEDLLKKHVFIFSHAKNPSVHTPDGEHYLDMEG